MGPAEELNPARSAAAPVRRPTMRDVARVAGVSLSTVSRVVNGSPVDEAMAGRVADAVELLGYRHNVVAGSLRSARGLSASIGVIFEDVSNPFFSAIHRGAEDVARERSVFAFAGSSDEDAAQERQLAEAFLSRGVDGLVVVPAGTDHSYLLRDVHAGVALVFVDRPPRFLDADTVLSDNEGGAYAATARLIAVGHRRIGFLGDSPDIHTGAERLAGYRRALAEQGIPADPQLIRHPAFRAADAADVTRELLALAEPPTALFSAQNLISEAVLRTLHELGLERTIAVVGFDDITLADIVVPGLSVVVQDSYEMGREAATLLFSRLDGYDGPSRRVVLPTRLVERASSRIAPPSS
jgi:LacI family transcriptional regulator